MTKPFMNLSRVFKMYVLFHNFIIVDFFCLNVYTYFFHNVLFIELILNTSDFHDIQDGHTQLHISLMSKMSQTTR